MSTKIKGKPFQLRLEAPQKAKALRFQPRSMVVALETPSRVKMNANTRAPLTAFPAQCLRTPFFRLTTAVVVIDRKTGVKIFYQLEALLPTYLRALAPFPIAGTSPVCKNRAPGWNPSYACPSIKEAANLTLAHMENPRLLLSFVLLFAATRMSGQQGPPNRADFARIGVEQGRPSPQSGLDIEAASRFARLALDCVHKEYPNKIAHSMNSDADVAPPRKLTPAFYGCYDWHSSIHGHWLLARLTRTFPDAPFAPQARAALQQSLTAENLQVEAAYLQAEGRASFERPYGLAWLLQLSVELRDWAVDDPHNQTVHALSVNLLPLEQSAVERLKVWLPKLSYPIRIGEHNQTAFSMGLMIDYARRVDDQDFTKLLLAKARQFYLADKDCPLAYEPSGEDFLSPCLAEADVMRRVLSPNDFALWLKTFLPQIPRDGSAGWLPTQKSTDPSDPKLAHIDGLNLSRAWMLEGIASGLPANDPRLKSLAACAAAHRSAGLAAVTGEHYEGGHWLGSFAVYLVTRRGIAVPKN